MVLFNFYVLVGCVCFLEGVPLLLIILTHSLFLDFCLLLPLPVVFLLFGVIFLFVLVIIIFLLLLVFLLLCFLFLITDVILIVSVAFFSPSLCISHVIVLAVALLSLFLLFLIICFFFSPGPPCALEKENNGKNKYLILFASGGSLQKCPF